MTRRTSSSRSVDPNFKDEQGTPLIMNTVLYGDVETLRMVLDSGADPNATNPVGATALLWSAGDPPRASLLLARGADANVRSALGRTPLLAAASRDGTGEIVEKLLAAGCDAIDFGRIDRLSGRFSVERCKHSDA